jgi:hypothetical protein
LSENKNVRVFHMTTLKITELKRKCIEEEVELKFTYKSWSYHLIGSVRNLDGKKVFNGGMQVGPLMDNKLGEQEMKPSAMYHGFDFEKFQTITGNVSISNDYSNWHPNKQNLSGIFWKAYDDAYIKAEAATATASAAAATPAAPETETEKGGGKRWLVGSSSSRRRTAAHRKTHHGRSLRHRRLRRTAARGV